MEGRKGAKPFTPPLFVNQRAHILLQENLAKLHGGCEVGLSGHSTFPRITLLPSSQKAGEAAADRQLACNDAIAQ